MNGVHEGVGSRGEPQRSMAIDEDNIVTKVRLTNSVGRELVFKIFFWYLNRKELLYAIIGFPVGAIIAGLATVLFGKFNPLITMGGAVAGILGGMQVLSWWRADRPSSYMWDSFHKWGLPLVLGDARGRLRVCKSETLYVPEGKPEKSAFLGTTDEGIALCEPWQTQYGLPNWAERADDGRVSRSIMTSQSLLGVIVIETIEEGEGPAPIYHRDADPIPERGETEADLIEPKSIFRRVAKPVPWPELL